LKKALNPLGGPHGEAGGDALRIQR